MYELPTKGEDLFYANLRLGKRAGTADDVELTLTTDPYSNILVIVAPDPVAQQYITAYIAPRMSAPMIMAYVSRGEFEEQCQRIVRLYDLSAGANSPLVLVMEPATFG